MLQLPIFHPPPNYLTSPSLFPLYTFRSQVKTKKDVGFQ
jgi:hypothetical protein